MRKRVLVASLIVSPVNLRYSNVGRFKYFNLYTSPCRLVPSGRERPLVTSMIRLLQWY